MTLGMPSKEAWSLNQSVLMTDSSPTKDICLSKEGVASTCVCAEGVASTCQSQVRYGLCSQSVSLHEGGVAC